MTDRKFHTYFILLACLTISACILVSVIKNDIRQLDRLRSIEFEQEQQLLQYLMEFKIQLDRHEESSHFSPHIDYEFSKQIIESTLTSKDTLAECLSKLSSSWAKKPKSSLQFHIIKQLLWDTKKRILALTYDLELELMTLNLREREFYASDIPYEIPATGRISSNFGLRKHPITNKHRHHDGMDIANTMWTDIESTAKGKVIFSGKMRGYGKTVILDHGNGFQTLYAHAQDLRVTNGEYVSQGNVIAKMGSTGTSTGPHVHYEVHLNGSKINPERLIPAVW